LVVLANEDIQKLFLGLLVAKEESVLKEIVFDDSSTKKKLIDIINGADADEILKQLNGLLTRLQALNGLETQVALELKKFKDNPDNKNVKVGNTFERYQTYAERIIDVLDYSTLVVKMWVPVNQNSFKKVSNYLTIGRTGVELTTHMYEKRYNLAFLM